MGNGIIANTNVRIVTSIRQYITNHVSIDVNIVLIGLNPTRFQPPGPTPRNFNPESSAPHVQKPRAAKADVPFKGLCLLTLYQTKAKISTTYC